MHRDADERSFDCRTGGGQCGSLCLTTNDVIKVHHTPEFHCYLHSTRVPGKTLQSDMRELYLEAMRSGGHGSTDVVFNVGKEKVHAHKVCSTPTTTTNHHQKILLERERGDFLVGGEYVPWLESCEMEERELVRLCRRRRW